MTLRRGFKSEAERIAKQVRAELELNGSQSIAPETLANLLGIEIRAGDELIPEKGLLNSTKSNVVPSLLVRCALQMVGLLLFTTHSHRFRARRATSRMNLRTSFLTTN